MRLIIRDNKQEVANWIADYVVYKINTVVPALKEHFVLGLPTGSSPIPIYQRLIELYKADKVSFQNVITFNMDEYIGIPENHPQSYHSFMWKHLFNHIDIPENNVNIPNGNAIDLEFECAEYEEKIKRAGGIDLFIAGIGSDGHIAFNEPGSSLSSRTRIKLLTYDTIVANSRFFDNDVNKVPKMAITIGIATIMDAKEVIVIVTGYNKAHALDKIVEQGVNHIWTASMLQLHPHCIIVCDEESTMELKVGTVKYFKDIEIEMGKLPMFSYKKNMTYPDIER
ncbi:MAG: glucosamine-6-phosphate deaminase [Candidatus Cloacimonadota bacterium]|nr:MAG: glucosamine-6-phosphate deaminase [Candidatus Cloacimonadota bacterium]